MNGSRQSYLGGSLGTHARGRTLAASFGATACDTLPVSGTLFVLGKEVQANSEKARAWVEWTAEPGRVLVAVPPFWRKPCDIPAPWEARRTEPLAGGETALGRLLARERRHEIRGQLLPLERTAGQVVTAGWRKHPAAGLVVITALPIWSLTALDHEPTCSSWLTELLDQAGTPVETAESGSDPPISAPQRIPTPDEWTFLLHLCTGPFDDDPDAVDALSTSPIQELASERAEVALRGLISLGLAEAGALTAAGERALHGGPYSAYADALRRRR